MNVEVGVTWRQCPKCGKDYGYETEGGKYLRVGGLKLMSMRAECGECGQVIWWYSSDRHLKRIKVRSENG